MKKAASTRSSIPVIQREMDGLGPEWFAREPALALAGDICEQHLADIRVINAAMLSALASAAQDPTAHFPLDASLRTACAALSCQEIDSLARCQSLLIDAMSLIPGSSIDAEKRCGVRPSVWLSPTLLNSMAWQSVLLAWHLCQLTRGACIVLGCPLSVARRLASFPIVQLPSLVKAAEQTLRIRWVERPDIWEALIQSVRQGANLRRASIQLLALRCDGLHAGDRS